MRRTEKYPETSSFHYHNENPHGRLTEDCVFRSIASATGKEWSKVLMEMAEVSCKTGYAITGNKCIEKYLSEIGWIKHPQPKMPNGTKLTGTAFCKKLTETDPVIANIGGHHIVCIREHDGQMKVHDTWDCTYKCIGNYWTKGE